MLDLSIIIVSYNACDYLRQCLRSIHDTTTGIGFEVIVVDNCSEDGSREMLVRDYPHLSLIPMRENAGFARAVNRGIAEAEGRHILLLNSDTVVFKNTLGAMVGFLDSQPDTAVVSAHVVYPDFTDQGVARRFPTPLSGLFGRKSLITRLMPNHSYARKYILSSSEMGQNPLEVDWVSGACLMVRADVLREVGLLDNRFWMYWEDADLCHRIKLKGLKVFCLPAVKVVHYEGKSVTGRASARSIIEFHKSACRYFQKHHTSQKSEVFTMAGILCISLRAVLKLAVNALAGMIALLRNGGR